MLIFETMTETFRLSEPMLGDVARTIVVQGSGVRPPWESVAVTSTSPVGIVIGAGTDTQVGSSADKVTTTPGLGTGTSRPPLRNRMTISPGKLFVITSDVATMSSCAVVATADVPLS
jgi:hypothetical protein